MLTPLVRPIDILGIQICDIGLGPAEVPEKLVKRPSFGVRFPRQNPLMFIQPDRPFLAKSDLWPLAPGYDRLQKPVEGERKVVNPVIILKEEDAVIAAEESESITHVFAHFDMLRHADSLALATRGRKSLHAQKGGQAANLLQLLLALFPTTFAPQKRNVNHAEK